MGVRWSSVVCTSLEPSCRRRSGTPRWRAVFPVVDTGDDEPAGRRRRAGRGARTPLHCRASAPRRRNASRATRALAGGGMVPDRARARCTLMGASTGSERVATVSCVVGIVKRHRTLYVAANALPVIAGLAAGGTDNGVPSGAGSAGTRVQLVPAIARRGRPRPDVGIGPHRGRGARSCAGHVAGR